MRGDQEHPNDRKRYSSFSFSSPRGGHRLEARGVRANFGPGDADGFLGKHQEIHEILGTLRYDSEKWYPFTGDFCLEALAYLSSAVRGGLLAGRS
jgi:hypothetical protein